MSTRSREFQIWLGDPVADYQDYATPEKTRADFNEKTVVARLLEEDNTE